MAGFVKNSVRVGLIVALAGGAAVIVAGPHRVGAVLTQTRDSIHSAIDRNIDDPVALRSQLRSLEAQYPEKIAKVASDLASLRGESKQLERELAESERVVELAQADIDGLDGLITKAEYAAAQAPEFTIVTIRFDDRSLSVDDAVARGNQIRGVRDAYATRAEEIGRDMGYLAQQEQRLQEVLATLEAEHRDFQTQLFQLDRQIDAVARNDRLIEMMEEREETIARHSKFEAASLNQFQGRMADIRAAQEAKLAALANSTQREDYVSRAKRDLDVRAGIQGGGSFQKPKVNKVEVQPPTIEVTPDSDEGQSLARNR